MLATFVIGLREGLEAALIVGIVAAFLRQRGRLDALRLVWLGVGLAVVICVAVGVGLQLLSASLPQAGQEGLETVVSVAAVAMVTYMIVWMRRHARDLRGQLEGATASALAEGTAWALVAMAFLAVLREGFETAVFLLAAFQASGSAGAAGLGAGLGVAVAVGLGYGIYRGGVRLNLSRFFRATGFVLAVVAAGLVATALHTAHEAGWLDVGQAAAIDLSWLIVPGSLPAALITGVLGLQPVPAQIEIVGWLAYAIPVGLYVAWPSPRAGRVAGAAGAALAVVIAAVAATGWSGAGERTPSPSSGPVTGGATIVTVILTDAGCEPRPATIPAGPVTFAISNVAAGRVSEFEIVQDGRILGERENLAPGLSGTFSLVLAAGGYEAVCPNATTPRSALTVGSVAAGSPAPTAAGGTLRAALDAATAGYATYVRDQVARLVTATAAFTTAVKAGDVEGAKRLYGPARVYWERIEPVAESFGDLDPAVDIREPDVTDPADFTGFHRIEKALWVDGSTAGMAPIADRLTADVERLRVLVATETYQPAQLANGASELLDEVAGSKVTGEEEAYSHLDLLDFQANVDGARAAFELLLPALREVDPTLATTIAGRFDEVDQALADHRTGDTFALYTSLTADQVRDLAARVNALAEPLSEVAAKVVGG